VKDSKAHDEFTQYGIAVGVNPDTGDTRIIGEILIHESDKGRFRTPAVLMPAIKRADKEGLEIVVAENGRTRLRDLGPEERARLAEQIGVLCRGPVGLLN